MRSQVENKFEERITCASSVTLSEDIFNITGQQLSPTTVQRFFELIANKSFPSAFTLNVFSEYAGYSTWDDFQKKNRDSLKIAQNEKLIPDEYGLALFNICLKNHHFESALEYLKVIPGEGLNHSTVVNIAESLGRVIRNDKKARTILVPELAKLTNGRKYFYESFIDIDYITTYYQKALSDDYLRYSSPVNKQKYITDFAFAKAIEFTGYIKSEDPKKALRVAYELLHKAPIDISWQELAHRFPYARLISVYLISEFLKGKLTDSKIIAAIEKIEIVIENQSPSCAALMLAQLIMALNYCRKYDFVIDVYTKYLPIIRQSVKSNENYLTILNCVKGSFHQKGLVFQPEEVTLTIEFSGSLVSCRSDRPLI